ncbi:lysylphosphatidylglycerol synthase domain-containing protein [Pleurocapsa sp. PCC 7319]|uniref:lysylphosphatidylglycerol synthase domain-containing protein n=1 Tax=Pleurocapsa sp. PCC 7319 TaxID=118161 RepID=UPI000347AA7E|nr:lysylphosphatidylglycerol synthase domain-containing protein [Pleurocapsa sp. PCC 7319]
MKRDRLTRFLYPTLAVGLLVFSLCILNQELGRYNPKEILDSFSTLEKSQLSSAFCLTIIDYLIISTYDIIAFLCLNYDLNIKRILFTTFITYAVSNTTGYTLLIGGGIRYRFYSLWRVPRRNIAKVTALGNLTFWLGLLTLSGITFLTNSFKLPSFINLNISIIRYLGIIALLSVGTYLYFCWRRKCLRIKGKIICFPKLTTTLSQITIFSLDWALAAAVLYCLIPEYPDKSYFSFFSIYLLAMSTSIMSNVPGGIGVFETIIIFLLPKSISAPSIFSSLLAYRAIRFLIPLGIALILLGCFELRRKLNQS